MRPIDPEPETVTVELELVLARRLVADVWEYIPEDHRRRFRRATIDGIRAALYEPEETE